MTTRTLTIDGMTCGHCIKAVTMALLDVPGVAVRDVQIGRAVIGTDDSVVTPEHVATAIAEAGYTLVETRTATA
jgi:copper chaperone